MQRTHFLTVCLALMTFCSLAQDEKTAVTFEQLYDEPYAVNKLFIGFSPLYAELFTTNINAGFGAQAAFYYRDKFDVYAQVRMPYGQAFFDYNRDLAARNSDVTITPQAFSYLELGGTYHIKDLESTGKTKMILYKSSYKGDKWAARVPFHTEVPAKLRTIYGARAGVVSYRTTVDLNNVLPKQGLSNTDLVNESDQGLPATITNPDNGLEEELNAFTNMHSTVVYVGGSMGRFRNIAVSFDDYEGQVDDNLLTLYLDIMFAPGISVDPVTYNSENYSIAAVKTSPLGGRLGLDGKFNRTLSWAYGGEIGFRPGLSGRSFYTMFSISFPVFGSNLEHKVESFEK